jgi:hypothetical protein
LARDLLKSSAGPPRRQQGCGGAARSQDQTGGWLAAQADWMREQDIQDESRLWHVRCGVCQWR